MRLLDRIFKRKPPGKLDKLSAALLKLNFLSGSLDKRITFSRTTNATVTGSNGLIQYAPMNLLTFSEQFDNAAWVKAAGTSISANASTAPDGTSTADFWIKGSGTTGAADIYRNISFIPLNVPHTFSLYFKAAGIPAVRVVGGSSFSPTGLTVFNLSNGTVSSGSGSIESVGNGWYRCSIFVTRTSSSDDIIYIAPCNTNGTFPTGNGTSGIYIWGAQLELGSTATAYNPTTVKNLLGYTEHFDNAAWTKSNASISATKVDDIYGQPFAQKLVAASITSEHSVGQAISTLSGTMTFSCVMKQGEWRYGFLRTKDSGGTYRNIIFDLANGAAVLTETGWSNVGSVSLGGGWYRCYGTITIPVATNFATIGATNSSSTISVAGDGTSGIYIFGAQLSDSASVDPYVYNPVAATTSTAYYGPRFDYDPVTLAPKGLLIEEQRTNLLTYSEQFDNVAWTKTESSVTANAAVSPDGAATADKLIASTAATTHLTTQAPTVVSGTTYTFSVHLKAAEYGAALVGFVGGSGFGTTSAIVVNLATGAISAGTGTLLSSSAVSTGNGWWRVAVSLAASASAAGSVYVAVINGTTYADRLNAGNGTSGIYIWGAQLEAGAFATSYIPTMASQVTRAADSALMIGNNFVRWYTQGSSSWLTDTQSANGFRVFTLSDGTVNNQIFESFDTLMNVYTGGAFQAQIGGSNVVGKVGMAYATNDFAVSKNGGSVAVDTSGSLASAYTQIALGSNFNAGGSYLNGAIKRIAYYNRRLSNTELQGITS